MPLRFRVCVVAIAIMLMLVIVLLPEERPWAVPALVGYLTVIVLFGLACLIGKGIKLRDQQELKPDSPPSPHV